MSSSPSLSAAPLSAPSTPHLPIARADFPSWLPAMLVKELRQGLRTRGFVGVFIGFQIITMMMLLSTALGSTFGNATARAVMGSTINGFFWTLLSLQLLIVTPVRALGSLQAEIDTRTLDLLMLTRLTAWRIVIGKWFSLVAQAALLLVAMLPYGIIRYFLSSVDLVEDAVRCVQLLCGCAVLSAAGLFCSGLPKVVRIIVPVAVFFGLQASTPLLIRFGLRPVWGGPVTTPVASTGAAAALIWWINGAIVLGLCLVATVRRIAPPAENHARLTRALALCSLVPVPIWIFTGNTVVAHSQLQTAATILFVVCAVELMSWRQPLAAHWRGWFARNPLGRYIGRFGLPGWPSGLLFSVLATGLMMFCICLPGAVTPTAFQRAIWLPVVGLIALVLPTVILSFATSLQRSPAGYFILIFGVGTALTAFFAMMANNTLSPSSAMLSVGQAFPISGWWITLFRSQPPSFEMMAVQGFLGALVLFLAWQQARPYWKRAAKVMPRSGKSAL